MPLLVLLVPLGRRTRSPWVWCAGSRGQRLGSDREGALFAEAPVSAAPPRWEDAGRDNEQGTQLRGWLREDTKVGCHYYYYFLLFAMTPV